MSVYIHRYVGMYACIHTCIHTYMRGDEEMREKFARKRAAMCYAICMFVYRRSCNRAAIYRTLCVMLCLLVLNYRKYKTLGTIISHLIQLRRQ
jgi:hypothetical protein